MRDVLNILLAGILVSCGTARDDADSLARFATTPAPWLQQTANSEQWQPLYLGATPREMALGLPPADEGKPVLYAGLRSRGERQLRFLHNLLRARGFIAATDTVQVEAWPAHDDYGGLTWVMARWRRPGRAWRWLDADWAPTTDEEPEAGEEPVLPRLLRPEDPEDLTAIFADALTLTSLYDKPAFGECVWTEANPDGAVLQAWRAVDERERGAEEMARIIARAGRAPVCRAVPQPPRLNGKAVTFVLGTAGHDAVWPEEIEFKPETAPHRDAPQCTTALHPWPTEFVSAYRQDIAVLAGEREATRPDGRGAMFFRRKNNAQRDNQLAEVVDYLEARYRSLGLRTVRQEFSWRGMPHANLIAVLPGADLGAKALILADHIDTAFSEDVFEMTGERVSSPGADDNAAATAALLRAAEVLRRRRFRHDIWLVHLTGEEFPADDLGARHFAGRLLAEKKDVLGLVLLDLVGYRSQGDPVFQVNPGDSEQALRLAATVLAAASGKTGITPVLRTRFDERSYLYNTDGLIFADSGFPVVHLSEHINRLENFSRQDYHSSTDTSERLDLHYAATVVQTAIEAVACLAESVPPHGASSPPP